MKRTLTKKEKDKVDSWRWRIVKACGTLGKFAQETNRPISQVSEWVNGRKIPMPATIKTVENDLKRLGA